jgi:DNA-binding response OmpR family regulator
MSGRKILIVEDDPSVRSLLTEMFKLEGYETAQAEDGAVALERARLERPDLLILDMMLPVKSGEEVIRSFWDDPATLSVPILVVSAKYEEMDTYKQLLGDDKVFPKPFDENALVAKVKELIEEGEA